MALTIGTGADAIRSTPGEEPVLKETAAYHREIASQLLMQSFHSKDPELQKRLRSDALTHFIQADIIENGPYRV